ncbi:MAG: hypothetical protein ACRDMA_09295 [Solirubrobacterales bacterium]
MRRPTYLALSLFLIGLVLPRDLFASENAACHPALEPSEPHYVVGYGSLMEAASKERSWRHAGVSLPVRVRGFERSWNARGRDIGFSTTFLGVEPKAAAQMVAALYRVYDHGDFAAGDAREDGYCRMLVAPSQVTMLDGSDVPDRGKIWIYVLNAERSHLPDARFPIVQSYVDIFLSGCIELARLVVADDVDLLAACITTTRGWPGYWVNDRIYPRRPFQQPNATRIDEMLHRMLPVQFEAIRIE